MTINTHEITIKALIRESKSLLNYRQAAGELIGDPIAREQFFDQLNQLSDYIQSLETALIELQGYTRA